MPKFDVSEYVNLKSLGAVITGIVLLVATVLSVNAYFTKDCEFKAYVKVTDARIAEVDNKLLIYQAEQSQSFVKEKIWKIRDRIEQKPKDKAAKQDLRELEDEKTKLDTRIQDLKKGK